MDANTVGDRGGCKVLTKAGLTTGGDASNVTINTANVINFTIDGIMYSKAVMNNQALSAGLTAVPAGNECLLAVWVDSGGTVSVTQGRQVAYGDLSAGTGKTAIPMPDVVAAKALVGLIKVKAMSDGGTWTPKSTGWNGNNVVATFYDTSVMPTAPLTAA